MKSRTLLMITLLLVVPVQSRANGLIQQLPKDGSWVRYFLNLKSEQPDEADTGTLTIRSVGQVMVEGKPCRWIEFQFTTNKQQDSGAQIVKVLVPEKHLQKGAKPVANIVRGWQKQGNSDPEPLPAERSTEVEFFLPGPLKDVKQLKQKKVIDYQRGQLKCDSAFTGAYSLTPPELREALPEGFSFTLRYTLWPHKAAPFGVAAATMQITVKQNDKVLQDATAEFTLEDFGIGAKSALPDNE